jgi:hypothetical protein
VNSHFFIPITAEEEIVPAWLSLILFVALCLLLKMGAPQAGRADLTHRHASRGVAKQARLVRHIHHPRSLVITTAKPVFILAAAFLLGFTARGIAESYWT